MISGELPDNRCGGGYPFKDCPGPNRAARVVVAPRSMATTGRSSSPGAGIPIREGGKGVIPRLHSVSICWEGSCNPLLQGWVGGETPCSSRPESAGMMKNMFAPWTACFSFGGTSSIRPLIFSRAEMRSSGLLVMKALPRSA